MSRDFWKKSWNFCHSVYANFQIFKELSFFKIDPDNKIWLSKTVMLFKSATSVLVLTAVNRNLTSRSTARSTVRNKFWKAFRKTVLTFYEDQWLSKALCRSRIWIGMKVLGADSIILGTRKLWRMFPIKQKFHTTAAFLDRSKHLNLVKFGCFLCTIVQQAWCGKK